VRCETRGRGLRLAVRGEAPTTVEAPVEDVTQGVLNAVREVEELCGRRFIDGGRIAGVDAYVSTSSAGGGLQMMVAGVVHTMTAGSAARAALGARGGVMDTRASRRPPRPPPRVSRISHPPP